MLGLISSNIRTSPSVPQHRAAVAIAKMESAGFKLAAHGGKLRVAPAERLTAAQREWIAEHKAVLVAALAARADPVLATLVEQFDARVISVTPLDSLSLVSVPSVREHEPFTQYPVWHHSADGWRACHDCRHAIRAADSDAFSWTQCGAGHGGGFAMQYRDCAGWTPTE